MAAEDDDAEAAADRLEAALDRIAQAAEHAAVAHAPEGGITAGQVAARLDSLIARLRAELDGAA